MTDQQRKELKDKLAKETKTDKFVRLANARVSNILRQMKHLGNLGGANYESNELQRKAINTAITSALNTTMDRMNKVKATEQLFKL